MGDQQKSADYFFRPLGGEVENRVDEPRHVTEARDIMQPADLLQTWRGMPPDITPLSQLGRLLGGADIAKPSQAELSRFVAGINALNLGEQQSVIPSFNDRWISPR